MKRECRQVRGILFRLEGGWYFIDIMRVHEIIRPPELCALVSMPPFVAGVITRRGAVIPIINLRERFELPGQSPESRGRILVLALPGQRVGILADEVTGVLTLSVDSIQPPPSLMNARVAPFFIGLASDRERLISLVNIDMLLSAEERGVLDSLAVNIREDPEEGKPCS
jgi:purine-binding chemotaxis protein CheW